MNLNQDTVPVNLEEAVHLLQLALSPSEMETVRKSSTSKLHLSLGMYIRNEWSLWDVDTILVTWFRKTYGIHHADDVSAIIIECLVNDLNGQPRQDKVLAKQLLDHWKKKQ